MTERSVIEFECNYCLNKITAPAVDCGKQLKCPSCKTVSIVPSRPIDLNLFDNIFEPVDQQPLATTHEENVQPAVESQTTDHPLFEILADAAGKLDPKLTAVSSMNAPSGTSPESHLVPIEPAIPADSNAPLAIDGIDDTDLSKVFGIKCNICDTRIHVSESEIGTQVECPVCFSRVKVMARESKPKSAARWMPAPLVPTGHSNSAKFGDVDELRLSPPVERPPVEFLIDPSFGLAPVADDLLAPVGNAKNIVPNPNPETVSPDITLPDNLGSTGIELHPLPDSLSPKAPRERSRRELYEAAQRRQIAKEQSASWWSDRSKTPTTSNSKKSNAAQRSDEVTETDFAEGALNQDLSHEIKFDFFWQLVIKMCRSPGLQWRAIIAGSLIGIGSGIMHLIAGWYRAIEDPTFGDWLWNTTLWMGFGVAIYAIGVLLLWFVCGFVFRETAVGNRQVSTWQTQGTSDAWSTMLVFSFSFFIAGLPLAFFPVLVMPFRCLVAPPLLLAAWFNKSPFAIVAVDAFLKFNRQWRMWRSLYLFLLALAGVSLVGGLLMAVRVFILSFVTSLVGAAILMLVTIAFATVTGWHCGQVLRELENENVS